MLAPGQILVAVASADAGLEAGPQPGIGPATPAVAGDCLAAVVPDPEAVALVVAGAAVALAVLVAVEAVREAAVVASVPAAASKKRLARILLYQLKQ